MNIKKYGNCLQVDSYIYFDETGFCIRPRVHLLANKDKPLYRWNEYSIGIAVRDYDDFDMGLVYQTDIEHFDDVLHELINWMLDHEQGISLYKNLLDPFEFFPECKCKREMW